MGIQVLSGKINELEAKHKECTAELEERKDELEKTDKVLKSVVTMAVEAAGRDELLACPVFYSQEEAPMQFDLAGETIMHPRCNLMIEEIQQETIEADKKKKKLEEKLEAESKRIAEEKKLLEKLKANVKSITGTGPGTDNKTNESVNQSHVWWAPEL